MISVQRQEKVKDFCKQFSNSIRYTVGCKLQLNCLERHLLLPFPKQALDFMCLYYKSFENTVSKGEIAHNEQFLLFSRCFLRVWRTFGNFSSNLILSSANSFGLDQSKILSFGKWLTLSQTTNFRLFQIERV